MLLINGSTRSPITRAATRLNSPPTHRHATATPPPSSSSSQPHHHRHHHHHTDTTTAVTTTTHHHLYPRQAPPRQPYRGVRWVSDKAPGCRVGCGTAGLGVGLAAGQPGTTGGGMSGLGQWV
ncbi:hypothetical protein Tco_1309377 [Tanacetum coccineum]